MSDAAPSSAVRLAGRAFRFGVSLDRLETSPWVGIVVAVVLWGLVVIFAEPWGRLWGTGQDARCYYQATLADPYPRSPTSTRRRSSSSSRR